MLRATIVTTEDELIQIRQLNQQNLKSNIDTETQKSEGFVTWLYSLSLLEKMHQLAESIIIKDEELVVGYALTTLKEARAFHPDLETMFRNLDHVQYKGSPLTTYQFYCMGQICVAQGYRGRGVVRMLYEKHKRSL
jgi:hypothetical protein